MGTPVVKTDAVSTNEESRRLIRQGKVPPYMKNELMIGVNKSGIFAFQDATARLQKYTRAGQLQWERNMKLPVTHGVRADFFAQNGKFIYPLTYADGISVKPGGAAIQLHTTRDTTMVAWVPNDGRHIRVLKFPDLKPPQHFGFRFSVAPARHLILFVNSMEGTVVKAKWPVSAPDEE